MKRGAMKQQELAQLVQDLNYDKVSWIRDVAVDALESAIRDCEQYNYEGSKELEKLTPETVGKIRQALSLLKRD